MLVAFLKNLGIGVLAAVIGGVAAYFAAPEHFAGLGAFAGLAATVGVFIADALKKLSDKLQS